MWTVCKNWSNWWVSQNSVRHERGYKWTRARKDLSPHATQLKGVPAVSSKPVLCLLPDDFDYECLQTQLASKAFTMRWPWVSSRPKISLLIWRSRKWSILLTAPHEARQSQKCAWKCFVSILSTKWTSNARLTLDRTFDVATAVETCFMIGGYRKGKTRNENKTNGMENSKKNMENSARRKENWRSKCNGKVANRYRCLSVCYVLYVI